jgi:putative hemolysin
MEPERKQPPRWARALHLGGHRFVSLWLLLALVVTASAFLLPMFFFYLGSGWVAPLLLIVVLLLALAIVRRVAFSMAYGRLDNEEDAALMEYFVQHNTGGTQEEDVSVELLENALHLKQIRVKDCMSPRTEIVHVDVEDPVEDLRKLFVESSMSRILVTDGDVDKTLGYVHVQQLFNRPRSIRSMVLPIRFVPETLPVNELLQKLIQARRSIACVVDEYGSISGVITMEDALEQLFGNIDDEHDHEEFIQTLITENEYLLSGRLRIDYLNAQYPKLHLPEGEYQTLAGYVVNEIGAIPEQGATFELNGKTIVVELVSDRKIETIRIICN